MNSNEKELLKEFERFNSAPDMAPPEHLTRAILNSVHTDLKPSMFYVSSKVLFIHVIVGFVTLLFCPQFGLGLYKDVGIMAFLMNYGHHVCMLGCGALFLGSSALVSSAVLKPQELRVLRRSRVFQFAALGILSITIFLAIGADVTTPLALSWLIGAIAGAVMLLESGWAARRWLFKLQST